MSLIPRRTNTVAHTITRCYGDVKWLRRNLERAHPTGLVPPIVPKPFIKSHPAMRAPALARFVARITGHPRLRRHPATRAFFNPHLEVNEMGKRKGQGLGLGRGLGLGSLLGGLKAQTKDQMDPELAQVWRWTGSEWSWGCAVLGLVWAWG